MCAYKQPKCVFLITIDALRADLVGCIGGGNLTPNIDKIAQESLLFTRAFANGPGTNQSFPAIMTSTYFLMNNGFRLSPRHKTLAEIMRENGYKTVAFHSNPFLSKTFGWDRGFDEFYDFMGEIKSPSAFVTRQQGKSLKKKVIRFIATQLGRFDILELIKKVYYESTNLDVPYLEGKVLNKKVCNWIKDNLGVPFFIWMHYMDPHYPYIPPDQYCEDFSRKEAFEVNISADDNNLSNQEMEVLRELYEREVNYTDSCVGNFIEFLKNAELLKDSLIFITADHGEAFMEHNRFGHKPDILYNEVLHIPLLIYGLGSFLEINFPVQLLDVSPTILDVLGIEKPKTFLGDSLISLIEKNNVHRPIFSESAEPDLINLEYNMNKKVLSCIKGKWKLIINELYDKKELYNLHKDFKEKNNIIEIEKQISQELTSLIEKHLSICLVKNHY